jgi:hypothetical protein
MGMKADHVLMLTKGLLDESRMRHFWRKSREGHPYILGTNNSNVHLVYKTSCEHEVDIITFKDMLVSKVFFYDVACHAFQNIPQVEN